MRRASAFPRNSAPCTTHIERVPPWTRRHAQTITYEDVWLLGGVRTPFADYNGTLRDVSATDLGIKVAREALAATGVRCTLTLALELHRSKARYGIATACAGGGQGVAILIENPAAAS